MHRAFTRVHYRARRGRYNLDAGTAREVLLDYNLIGRGNGASDLFVYGPVFATSDQNFYPYSMCGQQGGPYGAEGRFAEWSLFDEPPVTPVPEPPRCCWAPGCSP